MPDGWTLVKPASSSASADGWTMVTPVKDRLYDPTRKPVSPEDFTETKTSTAREVAKGVLKGAVKSFSDLGELAVNAGMIPGVLPSAFNPDMRHPVFTRTEEATTATNTPQRVGRGLETAAELAIPAYEAGKLAVTAAKAIPSLARSAAEPIARALASETPLLTQGRQLAAKKILGHVLESAPSAANKGGKLVTAGARPSAEGEIAAMLDDLRAPEPPPSVELPTPAALPPGYTPRATVPPIAEPAAAPAPQGRLVPVKAPPVEAQIAEALAEARQPTPPALVTTPPPAELPPGYTPRSTVPKVVRERMAARQAAKAAAESPASPVPPKPSYPPPPEGHRYLADIEDSLPKASATTRDGLTVRKEIPNLRSIESSLEDFHELPGVREIPMDMFDPAYKPKPYSVSESARLDKLQGEISASKEINPLIVVLDAEKHPYILEGGHRFDALRRLGVKSVPAKVVIDTSASTGVKLAERPAAVKTAMSARTPPAPPKRAYFLRSPEDIAAASAPADAVQPTGSITIDDLPEAWKSRTGQDLFPTTGAEAKEITAALRAEIKDRGMTIGQAIAAVSKNRNISTELRYQIQRSLSGAK